MELRPTGGRLTAHVTLAQYFNPDRNRDAQGQIDYAGMVERAIVVRQKYATNPLVRADFVKQIGKLTMRQSSLILLRKGFVVSFTFIAGTEDELDELIERLSFGPAKP